MWNSLFKFTLVSYIWKRYRRTLTALPILLLYFWVVNLIHDDVITYATINQDTSWVAGSFLVKWVFIFIGVAVFVMVHMSAKLPGENSLLESFKKDNPIAPDIDIDIDRKSHSFNSEASDVFNRIRNKEKLRSKADIIIAKHKK